jgi:predicted nucleic acid-binding protein
MKKKPAPLELWPCVMDSSSLINIQRKSGVRALERRKGRMVVPEKVAYEVAHDPRVLRADPLRKFILDNPEIVTSLEIGEEQEYLRIAAQPGIDPGEAQAMAIALTRKLPLVIDEKETRARGKANNHGISTLNAEDFMNGGFL